MLDIFLSLDDDGPERLAAEVQAAAPGRAFIVVRRSLDARRGGKIGYRYRVALEETPAQHVHPGPHPGARGRHVLVVGAGPAGLFAAYRLVHAGARVTLVEQGKAVQPRRHDLASLTQRGELSPTSNYCFGEGGAGTFSDGKLYTRVKDRQAVAFVLGTLVRMGGPPEIAFEARAHVGSNRLPKILTALREHLEGAGVAYRFEAALEDLVVADGAVQGGLVRTAEGLEELRADAVVLATGHSARAVYEVLHRRGVALEPKPLAVGVRAEHPQPLIDEIQYGKYGRPRHPRLPAALYELTCDLGERRGAYSFCMCPGGWIVPCATEPGGLVTNGMSLARRDSPHANAALVVSVDARDYGEGPLAALEFQRKLERAAYEAGGGGFVAAATRVDDFLAGRASSEVARSSYLPGVQAGDVAAALPPRVVEGLRIAIRRWDKMLRGFGSREGHLVGVETRTSAPVRVVRDRETLASPSHPGLYPVGEGAGFAGGIVSAAIDGLRAAEALLRAPAS